MTLHVNTMLCLNADKSKLLICRYKQCKVVRDIKGRPFHISGRDIEQVDSFSHLGHIITSDFRIPKTLDIDVTDLWDRYNSTVCVF